MSRSMILITGATGQVGGAATRALLARGAGVRVLVRDRARAEDLPGAAIVVGSFDDEPSLARAMSGVGVLLLAGRDHPDQVAQHENVIRAAERAGVRQIVKLSAIGASPSSPIEMMRHHGVIEQRVRDGATAWTLVRPHLYLQNLLRLASSVRADGQLRLPMGTIRAPLVDTRDVGAALAVILDAASDHEGATYSLTGPAAYGYDDIARALSPIIGRPVAYKAIPPEQYRQDLLAAGMPDWRASDLAYIATAYQPADWVVTDALEALLGHPSRSLAGFLADYQGAFTNQRR